VILLCWWRICSRCWRWKRGDPAKPERAQELGLAASTHIHVHMPCPLARSALLNARLICSSAYKVVWLQLAGLFCWRGHAHTHTYPLLIAHMSCLPASLLPACPPRRLPAVCLPECLLRPHHARGVPSHKSIFSFAYEMTQSHRRYKHLILNAKCSNGRYEISSAVAVGRWCCGWSPPLASRDAHQERVLHALQWMAAAKTGASHYKSRVTQTQTFTPLRVAFAPSIVPFRRTAGEEHSGSVAQPETRERASLIEGEIRLFPLAEGFVLVAHPSARVLVVLKTCTLRG